MLAQRPLPTLRANTRAGASAGDVAEAAEHGRASDRAPVPSHP